MINSENIKYNPDSESKSRIRIQNSNFKTKFIVRHSAKTWLIAKSYCDIINTSLLTIYNESFQEEIYKLMGEYNYWTGLFSYLHVDPIWRWSNSNITLSETNYTNWGIGQPDIKDGYNLCVSDTNSTNLIQGWTPLNCEIEHKFFMCYKAPSLPEMSERKSKQIIKILAISIGSLLFILAIIIIGVKSYQRFKLNRARMRNRLVTNLSNSTNSTWFTSKSMLRKVSISTEKLTSIQANQEQVIDPSATPELGCARQQEAAIIDSELPLITSLLQQASGTILSRSTSMNLNMELRQPDRATFGRIINSMIPNANRLIFPHDTRAYEFNYDDIENLKLLEATPRNIIKKAARSGKFKIVWVLSRIFKFK
uniref:C-type lectin domain-containing protein n=1 Tax=Acrobeloides nanus TaxID=290746 RepID=A0A914CTY2_9BILA